VSEQQTVFVLGFHNQAEGTVSVLQYLLGEDVNVVFCGVEPNDWWVHPQRHASRVTLVTKVKTDLPWNRVDRWLKGPGFTRFLAQEIIRQSGLVTPPSRILVNDKLFTNAYFARAFKTVWPDVERKMISDLLMSYSTSERYLSYRKALDDVLIEELDLGVLAYNILKRGGIQTIGNLAGKTLEELNDLPTMRDKTLKEVVEVMRERGVDIF
jgi:Bacterial RNA polymerase, alpha chain C terminal domain